jgi:hypothetical protein
MEFRLSLGLAGHLGAFPRRASREECAVLTAEEPAGLSVPVCARSA